MTLESELFFNEICGIEPSLITKAVKWARKQRGWHDSIVAAIFYKNYHIASNPPDHIPTFIACMDASPDFKSSLDAEVHEDIFKMFSNPYHRDKGKQLLNSLLLAGALYSYVMTPASEIFRLFETLLYLPELTNTRRIEMYKTILNSEATIKFLIENGIAQRLLSSLNMLRTRTDLSDKGDDFPDPMSRREIVKMTDELAKINFFTKEVLEQDKMEEFQVVLKNWCSHKAKLKETLAAFASFDFKYPEQLRHFADHDVRIDGYPQSG